MNNATFEIGPYTVRIGLRHDNPAWPLYLVFRREKLIGKHFSRPGLSDCEWLERNNAYAKTSRWPETSEGRPIWNTPKRRGRPRKDQADQALREAMAS